MEVNDKLCEAAAQLNAARNMLCASVARLEEQLKRLNLGVQAWCNPAEDYAIGYAKLNKRWGVLLRDKDAKTYWRFQDAPTHLRAKAVKHIPDLLVALVKSATDMTEQVEAAAKLAKAYADAIHEEASHGPYDKQP